MGLSLWLAPLSFSLETTALQDVITSLSKTHSSPTFPPHITLANLPACISVPEIIVCLSSEDQLEVFFQAVRTGQTFFQSVFIVIRPSQPLFRLHDHVHRTLGVQPKTPEFAHLSLYYGDEARYKIADRLWVDGIVQTVAQGSESPSVSVNGVHRFLAAEVWVVNCQGRPEDWIVLHKFSLRKRQSLTADPYQNPEGT